MSDYLVGLTGGIGSGKTAAADHFASLGINVVDADLASRIVVQPGRPALAAIEAKFGAQILLDDGTLDRTALRHTVFADDDKRRWLQSLLHPLISDELRAQIERADSAYAILVNPLLFESGQNTWCQRVLVIDVPEETQLTRTMARDSNTLEQVENIMRAQMDRQKRLSMADDIISNDDDLTALQCAIETQNKVYLQLCQNQPA